MFPVYTGCNTSYYPNYYVSHPLAQTATRRYYSGVPQYIEAVKHSYVETSLIKYAASGSASKTGYSRCMVDITGYPAKAR